MKSIINSIEDCEQDDQDPGSWLEDEIEAKSKIALVENTYLNRKTSKILCLSNQIVLSITCVYCLSKQKPL